MKTYLWIEDRKNKSGYIFWQTLLGQLCPEIVLESKQNNSELVKAVKDLCEASRHIQPEYQERAMAACWIELARQIAIDAQGGNL